MVADRNCLTARTEWTMMSFRFGISVRRRMFSVRIRCILAILCRSHHIAAIDRCSSRAHNPGDRSTDPEIKSFDEKFIACLSASATTIFSRGTDSRFDLVSDLTV